MALERSAPPLYVYHEIVHNKHVVERFRERGVVFVDRIDRSARRGDAALQRPRRFAARFARGPAAPPADHRRHLSAGDQGASRSGPLRQQGYTIFLIGHEGHDEVIGTMGEAPEHILLVETPEDVDRLELPTIPKLAYLTQTTLERRRREPRHRPRCGSGFRRSPSAQGRHLLRHAEPARGGARAGARGRPGAGGGQPQQLELRAAGRGRRAICPRYLIDDVSDIDPPGLVATRRWCSPPAPALPELVLECLDWLQNEFHAEVERRMVREEDVVFPLPAHVAMK